MASHTVSGAVIPLDVRREQLVRLVETLRDIVRVIHDDPTCRWREHFERSLSEAEVLLRSPFSQRELNEFSSSVCSVYDARRTLADYMPPVDLPDAKNFSTYASVAYERALELRAI